MVEHIRQYMIIEHKKVTDKCTQNQQRQIFFNFFLI
jgi:hypothetical protein